MIIITTGIGTIKIEDNENVKLQVFLEDLRDKIEEKGIDNVISALNKL